MTLAVTLILCTHISAQRDSSIYQVVEPFPDTHISQNHIRYSTREIREDVNAVAIGQMNVLDTYLSPPNILVRGSGISLTPLAEHQEGVLSLGNWYTKVA